MGQKILTSPYEYGDDCSVCVSPPYSVWPAGQTPAFIFCCFWGVEYCGFSSYQPPNGDIFRLPQLEGTPCIWFKDTGTWHVTFEAYFDSPPRCRLRLADADGWSFFVDSRDPCPSEYEVFSNEQTSCILSYAGKNGHGSIWWNEELLDLMLKFGITPGSSTFYEFFSANTSYKVHKFVNVLDRINVLVKKT